MRFQRCCCDCIALLLVVTSAQVSEHTTILWPTPIRHVEVKIPSNWHHPLSQRAIESALELSSNQTFQRQLLSGSEPHAASLNSAFFIWQHTWKQQVNTGKGNGVPPTLFDSTPGYSDLVTHFEVSARKFLLEVVGTTPELASKGRVSPREGAPADCWSSVHNMNDGSWHPPHHHYTTTEVVSGVFYASIPEGGHNTPGSLVFSDPRGFLPPFGQAHSVQPKEGTLVLFPSWLVHTVEPSVIGTRQNSPGTSTAVEVDAVMDAVPTRAKLSKKVKYKKGKKQSGKLASLLPESSIRSDWRVSFSCNLHLPSSSDVSKVAASGFAL